MSDAIDTFVNALIPAGRLERRAFVQAIRAELPRSLAWLPFLIPLLKVLIPILIRFVIGLLARAFVADPVGTLARLKAIAAEPISPAVAALLEPDAT